MNGIGRHLGLIHSGLSFLQSSGCNPVGAMVYLLYRNTQSFWSLSQDARFCWFLIIIKLTYSHLQPQHLETLSSGDLYTEFFCFQEKYRLQFCMYQCILASMLFICVCHFQCSFEVSDQISQRTWKIERNIRQKSRKSRQEYEVIT